MVLALLAGCVEDPAGGPLPVWTAEPERFWDAAWPADHRRDPDGTIAVADFPNPYNVGLLDNYLAHLDGLQGFGNNAPIYFPFEGPLDPLRLPTAAESVRPDSSLLLLDIDPASPWWGEAVPVQWTINPVESRYWPIHTLAVAPVFGFPLRPNTTYAAVITTGVADPHPGFAEVWSVEHPLHFRYAPLRDALFLRGIAPSEVAVATVFTTGDPVDELARVARFVKERIDLPDLDLPLEELRRYDHYVAYRTHYPSPVFTHGDRPYNTKGGGFRFRESDGQPILAGWDDMRLAVCTPLDLSDPPEGGWPVVIYQHGTGGAYRGFCDSNGSLETANRLAQRGIIGLGIDQPLHGTRNGGQPQSDLANFNILNPESGVTNFRQGAVDAIYLAHVLAARPWTLRTPDGQDVPLDPDRVMFMGHSQGGITGALATPFMGGDVKAAMLSGAGGGLSITIVERKDVLDFAQLVRDWLQFVEGEEVTTLHPVVGLIQTAVEVTDPLNYAPYWFAERGDWPDHAPTPVLVTSGTRDAATPYRSATAMAAAGRVPLLHPAATATEALDLRGLTPHPGPLVDNAVAFNGRRMTAALSQWMDGSHWVVFERTAASDLYVNFLASAAEGQPSVWHAPE